MGRLNFRRALIWVLVLALAGTGTFADEDKKKRKPEDDTVPQIPALAPPLTVANDAEALMRLQRAVSNWNSTVAVLPDYRGWGANAPNPCGGGNPWTGVSCSQGQVEAM